MSAFVILCVFLGSFLHESLVFAKGEDIARAQNPQARRLSVQMVRDIDNDRWTAARDKLMQSKDPLAMKLYFWLLFTKKENADWDAGNFIRLTHFIRDNADWPGMKKLKVLVEGVMPDTLSNAEVLSWYGENPPETSHGMERYMNALIIEGKKDKARDVLANWWADTLVSRDQQREIFQKFGSYLTLDAHKRRLDALLYNEYYDNARAIAGVLGQGYPELAEARIALAKDEGGEAGAVSRVPRYLRDDAGLLYERLRWRRKHNMDIEAMEILHRQPAPEKIRNKEDWWKERHILIRRMLENRNYKSAYLLASKHFQTEGVPYAEAQFMSGWLALRHMGKPEEGYKYFTAMYKNVDTPVSKSRAAYWAGRAAAQMKKKDDAVSWYKKAAQFRTVFYGQLAANELKIDGALTGQDVPALSKDESRRYERNELVQASRVFHEAGLKDYSARFMNAFVESQGKSSAYRFAAEEASKMNDYNLTVNIAKKAIREGWVMTKQSYPVVTNWMTHTNNVEMALVHAIIRQESVFDTGARSGAGALGLMQLMPRTAQDVSGKLDVSYSQSALTERPDYNIRLGSYYIGTLLKKYDGYYPLAIAAYNAGPGRVNEWLDQFGDPRRKEIDLLDWIEMIPVSETRNYVQRVMEGVYVYRLRLHSTQPQPRKPLDIANR